MKFMKLTEEVAFDHNVTKLFFSFKLRGKNTNIFSGI